MSQEVLDPFLAADRAAEDERIFRDSVRVLRRRGSGRWSARWTTRQLLAHPD